MNPNTTAKMIAESLMVDYAEKYGPTILKELSLADLKEDRATFTITLKNDRTYRITVTEEAA